MSYPIYRFQLDKTGTNPNNLIANETHVLSTLQVRSIAPTYGCYYTESLQVFDQVRNVMLIRNVDYRVAELAQEPTFLFGKEICLLVLIVNPLVSNTVSISYQCVGGVYQNNAPYLNNLYEAVMHDNRPVDWVNILNKPLEYPPALHNHFLSDIYGFETLVYSLERIRDAILLSNVPTLEGLIDWIINRFGLIENLPVITEYEIDNEIYSHKYVTYDRLIYALNHFGILPTAFITPKFLEVREGSSLEINIETENLKHKQLLYWEIINIESSNLDFVYTSGTLTTIENLGKFYIYPKYDGILEPTETFKIRIRKNNSTGLIIGVSSPISIINDDTLGSGDWIDILINRQTTESSILTNFLLRSYEQL